MRVLGTLVVLLLLGLGGWYLYSRVLMTPERRACGKLAELCGDKHAAGCTAKMEQVRKSAGDEAFQKAESCIARAESCLGAAGCLVGAQLSGLGDFLHGLGEGLGPELRQKGRQLLHELEQKLDEKKPDDKK